MRAWVSDIHWCPSDTADSKRGLEAMGFMALRLWLIERLAGRMLVVLNAELGTSEGALTIDRTHVLETGGMIKRCVIKGLGRMG